MRACNPRCAGHTPRGYNSKYFAMITIRPTNCPTVESWKDNMYGSPIPYLWDLKTHQLTILGQQPKDSGQSVHYWVFRTARLSSSFLLSRPIPRNSLINTTFRSFAPTRSLGTIQGVFHPMLGGMRSILGSDKSTNQQATWQL
jgi:hypothetical protein